MAEKQEFFTYKNRPLVRSNPLLRPDDRPLCYYDTDQKQKTAGWASGAGFGVNADDFHGHFGAARQNGAQTLGKTGIVPGAGCSVYLARPDGSG